MTDIDMVILIISLFTSIFCTLISGGAAFLLYKAIVYHKETQERYGALKSMADDLGSAVNDFREARADDQKNSSFTGNMESASEGGSFPPPFGHILAHVKHILESSPEGAMPSGMFIQMPGVKVPQVVLEAFEKMGVDVKITDEGIILEPNGNVSDDPIEIDPSAIVEAVREKNKHKEHPRRCEFNPGLDATTRCPEGATQVVMVNVPTREDVEAMQKEGKKASDARRLETRLCCAEHAQIMLNMTSQKGIAYCYPMREHSE